MRRTGLDEILQVWNVAAGQMALIGPRPWLPQEQLAVERLLPEARRRLAVRPGLIGLAAVLNRRPLGSDGYLAHATADLEYVATATPALDGRICWLALRVLMDGRDLTTGHVRSDAAESSLPSRGEVADAEIYSNSGPVCAHCQRGGDRPARRGTGHRGGVRGDLCGAC